MAAMYQPTVVLEGLNRMDLEAVHADVVGRDLLEIHQNLIGLLGPDGEIVSERKKVKDIVADIEAKLAAAHTQVVDFDAEVEDLKKKLAESEMKAKSTTKMKNRRPNCYIVYLQSRFSKA